MTVSGEDPQSAYVQRRQGSYSGILYTLKLKRDPGFYWTFYMLPAMLFVFLSYSSFWVDKNAVPARVALGILSILITLNSINSSHKYIT